LSIGSCCRVGDPATGWFGIGSSGVERKDNPSYGVNVKRYPLEAKVTGRHVPRNENGEHHQREHGHAQAFVGV
jgi:hypothetical protein